MDGFDRIAYQIAFSSMNSLIEIKSKDLTKGFSSEDFETDHDIKELMEKLMTIADINEDSESQCAKTDNKETADVDSSSENG